MNEVFDNDLAKELLTVLACCEEDFQQKIPDDLIDQLTRLAADSKKEFYLEEDKSLMEQNLSEECKDMLSILYYQSVDNEEKNNLLQDWASKD